MNKEIIEKLERIEAKFDKRLDKIDQKVDKLNENLSKFKVNTALVIGGLMASWETIKRKLGLWLKVYFS